MNQSLKTDATLIVGASSAIARALVEQITTEQPEHTVLLVSRGEACLPENAAATMVCFQCDYQPESVRQLAELLSEHYVISRIFIANGVLHGGSDGSDIFPEKQLSQVTAQVFQQLITANTLVPIYWLQQLELLAERELDVVVFSARVSSIADNRLGGWYSYRASKAALNMLVKTAAIELTRSHKAWRFWLFHPGTVDTPLSEPFQKNVPKEKLFTPEFVASQLLHILRHRHYQSPIQFVDWKGEEVQW